MLAIGDRLTSESAKSGISRSRMSWQSMVIFRFRCEVGNLGPDSALGKASMSTVGGSATTSEGKSWFLAA
jgi:hypothetical protein